MPVSFTSLTTGTCTVAGATPTLDAGTTSIAVTMVAGGLCTLRADQPGSDNYNPAPAVDQSFTINPGTQTITFAPIGDKAYGDAPFAVSATASSGLPVTIAAAGSCTVSGATVTLTSSGTCTLTASQGGDSTYQPAPNVSQAFAIDLRDVYTAVGSMLQPRSYHTATRFDSGPLAGWVLVSGGLDASGASTATSELYNPVTRTFAATGNLPSKSYGHSATLLSNGKVLALGGGNSSAQTYDPVARTWSPAGSLSSTRSFHTATVLGDGTNRVLIVGGADNAGKTIATSIVYTPANGTFAAGPSLKAARERHTATLLPNGKVLVVGGRQKSGNGYVVLGSAEVCDAAACTPVTVSGRQPHHGAPLARRDRAGGRHGAAGRRRERDHRSRHAPRR